MITWKAEKEQKGRKKICQAFKAYLYCHEFPYNTEYSLNLQRG